MRAASSRVGCAAVVVGLLAACDQAGTSLPAADAGAAPSALVDPAVLERGEYLVRSVAGCGDCHTPRGPSGELEASRWLAGVPDRFDLTPDDDTTGSIPAPNLTPAHLAGWSDDDVKHAFLDGVGSGGAPLFPLMPYYAYRNMTDDDATAIVTYLRALPSVATTIPARQPLPVALDAPAPPVPESAIPHTTLPATDARFASAEHGRYLAGEVGFCLDCHTPWRTGATTPLDLTRVFGGDRPFSAKEWAMPAPAPAVVASSNLTPHATGLAGWTPDDVVRLLHDGTPPGGAALCGPMPSGPTGGFGGLTDQDARDIGVYLTTLAPFDSGAIPRCTAGADE